MGSQSKRSTRAFKSFATCASYSMGFRVFRSNPNFSCSVPILQSRVVARAGKVSGQRHVRRARRERASLERATLARTRDSRYEKRGTVFICICFPSLKKKGGWSRNCENSRLVSQARRLRAGGGKARGHVVGRGSTAAAHAPPLFLGLASRAQIVHEVFLGQRRGDGAGLRDRGDDARRPATVPGRHAGVSEGRIVSPGRTDARGVRQARGRRVRGAAHVRRVASSNCAVDGRAMNVRWVVRNARRHLRISIPVILVLFRRLARKSRERSIDHASLLLYALCPNRMIIQSRTLAL